jgi:excisionase family DNA binding protein
MEAPLVYSVMEMAAVLHIGRNAAYELVKSGKIRSLRIGRNIRIPRAAILEYLETAT